MPPRKRARGASSSSSSSTQSDTPLTLTGGEFSSAGLAEQRAQNLFCDAEVKVSGTSFKAHRCVLALGSSYFKALYTSQMTNTGKLNLVSAATFEAVLAWLYEGKCSVGQDGLVPLLEAADSLGVLPLRDAAVNAIVERITVDSCIGAWDLADRCSLPTLATAAREACCLHLADLDGNGTLGALSVGRILELLQSDALQVKDEEAVFNCLKLWLGAQATEPSESEMASLVREIRFEQMDEAARARMTDEPLLQSLPLMKILARSTGGSRRGRSGYSVPSGVQLDIPDRFLEGWTAHYDDDYDEETKTAELLSVPGSAKFIFVGARDPEGKITIGAVGARDAVLQQTDDEQTRRDNEVEWYLTPEMSFGFAPAGARISQNPADNSSSEGPKRLSWHIDEGGGGYRAGDHGHVSDMPTGWRKLVYYK